jgi:glycosyltransferase involved in cell wall biosynthesis
MAESDFFKPVIIAPTFDNARTLPRVLSGIAQIGLATIAINDGCADETPIILQAWVQSGADRVVLTHGKNRGKAAALLDGFERASQMGFTHALTIDTDGQLDPGQIPELLRIAQSHPNMIVVGSREANAKNHPAASRWGRRVSNLLIKWESDLRISDSQCGFRVYPLKLIQQLKCRAGRYGFESEILTRAAWAGIAIKELNVNCIYDVPEGRVSHFRVWRDSLACAMMHLRLLTIALTRWINPIRAWRNLRCDPKEHFRFSTAVAAGVFIANLPLYGVQTLLSLFVAKRFRLNPLAVVAGSSISTPPLGPLLIVAAIAVGHCCLHGAWPQVASFDPRTVGYFALMKSVLLEWTIGGIICGTILALVSYCLMRLVLQCLPLRTAADSAVDPTAPATIRDHAIPKSAALER